MHSLQITEHQGGLWGMVVGQQKTAVTERVTETLIVQARVFFCDVGQYKVHLHSVTSAFFRFDLF